MCINRSFGRASAQQRERALARGLLINYYILRTLLSDGISSNSYVVGPRIHPTSHANDMHAAHVKLCAHNATVLSDICESRGMYKAPVCNHGERHEIRWERQFFNDASRVSRDRERTGQGMCSLLHSPACHPFPTIFVYSRSGGYHPHVLGEHQRNR